MMPPRLVKASSMTAKQSPAPRTLTSDDWRALMFVWTLFQEVSLHGKPALDNFIAAMRETHANG